MGIPCLRLTCQDHTACAAELCLLTQRDCRPLTTGAGEGPGSPLVWEGDKKGEEEGNRCREGANR